MGQQLGSTDLVNGTMLITLSGDPVVIQRNGGTLTADNLGLLEGQFANTADCFFYELRGVIVPSTISGGALRAGEGFPHKSEVIRFFERLWKSVDEQF